MLCEPKNMKMNVRPEGGIEPLCLSTPTGLKPATRTTECHLDILHLQFWP